MAARRALRILDPLATPLALLPRQDNDVPDSALVGWHTIPGNSDSFIPELCPEASTLRTRDFAVSCCNTAPSTDCMHSIFTACSGTLAVGESRTETCESTCIVQSIYQQSTTDASPYSLIGCDKGSPDLLFFRRNPQEVQGAVAKATAIANGDGSAIAIAEASAGVVAQTTPTPLQSQSLTSSAIEQQKSPEPQTSSSNGTPEPKTVTVFQISQTVSSALPSQTQSNGPAPSRLTPQVKVAIGVGVGLAVLMALCILALFWRWRTVKNKKARVPSPVVPETDSVLADDFDRKELDSAAIAEAPYVIMEVSCERRNPVELPANYLPGELATTSERRDRTSRVRHSNGHSR